MRVYRSKIGFWAYLYLGAFLVLTGYAWINSSITGGIILTASSGFIIWLYRSVKYILTEKELLIKPFGPVISLNDIIDIDSFSRYYFIASPALSLKRMKVKYKGGEVFISPQEKEQLIGELRKRCINLKG